MMSSPSLPQAWILLWSSLVVFTVKHENAFAFVSRSFGRHATSSSLAAAPKRFEDNVDGVLYVNEKCINCAACANFAPTVFHRTPGHHVVQKQPDQADPTEVEQARAALAACPVAAIRVESQAFRHHNDLPSLTEQEEQLAKSLGLSKAAGGDPFPRPLLDNSVLDHGVYYVGHHNDASFGATPYLAHGRHKGKEVWVMVDTPRFSKAAVRTVQSLTGPDGPNYLFLSHVDDSAHHDQWAQEFPNLKRIFHSGDLGRFNWIGDTSLEDVEVLLKGKGGEHWNLDGEEIHEDNDDDFVVWHTPGHSPGSISMLFKPGRVLFTGDTYAYSTRNDAMSGFPQYNSGGRKRQAETIQKIITSQEWDVVAPGHGHPRDYRSVPNKDQVKEAEGQEAMQELLSW